MRPFKKLICTALAVLLVSGLLCGCGSSASTGTGAPAHEAGVTYVSTIDELLDAIRPYAVIELAEGNYILSEASSYGYVCENEYVVWEQVYGGYELVLTNVPGLRLRAQAGKVVLLEAEPRYSTVLSFVNCPGLTLSGLTIGHTEEPGECSGGVLLLDSCNDSLISGCGLYGCGTIGIVAENCRGLTVEESSIFDCSYSALSLRHCRDTRVENCRMYDCGRSDIVAPLVEISTSSNTALLNCQAYDNISYSLISSYWSSGTFVMGCQFSRNSFPDHSFSISYAYLDITGYPICLSGCSFADYPATVRWYRTVGDFSWAEDLQGNQLTAPDLRSMEYAPCEDFSFPAIAETAAPERSENGVVLVSSVDELLSAIADNTVIRLRPGTYDLSSASSYGFSLTENVLWNQVYDGAELQIRNVTNLTIMADEGEVTIVTTPRYANVLSFINCSNIRLSGLVLGHTLAPGSCSGGVVSMECVFDSQLEDCSLYGCGILGLQAWACARLTVDNCLIYECSDGGVYFSEVSDSCFINTTFRDLGGPAIYLYRCDSIFYDNDPLSDGDYYDPPGKG